MSVGLSAHVCFSFTLLFHFFDLGNHPVDDILHLWHILLNGAEHYVGVNLKVMVGYLVAHPHHTAPVDFGIAGQQLAVRLLVESLHGLAQRNQIHADGIKAHHAAWRCEQFVGSLTTAERSRIVSMAMRIFRRLSITISRSNIDGLLPDAFTKQVVHAVADAHQIDAATQHPLQVGLDEVEREQ